MLPDFPFHFFADLQVILQELLRVLPSLADLGVVVRVPCAALDDHAAVCRQIQDIAFPGDAFSEHDVELRLPERRRDLILHHFHTGAVADHFAALFQRLDPAHVQTDG